jgi:Ran GTPase-activating protein (RanGAP) involved in mRNA processing and transport
MDKFVTSIKKKYQDRLTSKEDRWPPCHSSDLIRLELVEKKERVYPNEDQREGVIKRTVLAYRDVFKAGIEKKAVRKVLVEGGAGIGKTTLCIAISEDWANEKLFQQFKILLLLPLRHPKISKARSLSELLKLLHSSKSVCESVVNYLQEEEGENVLIIADGWDELDKSQQRAGSFLYELLLMELPFSSVLITSRPSASDPLRKHMDRFIDVLGFDKENIEEFIVAEFADNLQKATGLSEQLESNPLLESVCSVPLNCAIVCHLWRTLREVLPTTMTELYRKIMLNFILRNIRKTDIYHDIKLLTDFDSLPDDLQQSWWQLCEFSFQALIKSQIIFSREDLGEFFSREVPVDERLLFFGLLQPVETILETGCGVAYHFLHLTFQEYLSALYLVKYPLDKFPMSSDNSLLYQALSGNFSMVWRFYFGSYFHESKKHKPDIKLVKKHISGIRSFIKHDDLLLWHCAFEAKSKDIVDLALEFAYYSDDTIDDQFYKNYNIIDFSESSNAYDCEAILHGISNIEHCNTEIRFGNCSVREKQIETLGEILAEKEKTIQIMGLDLSGNKLTDRSVCNLFKHSSIAFLSLGSLNLSDNKIGSESIKSIMTTLKHLPFNILSELDLSQNPLGVPGIKALEDGIRCDSLVQLKELDIEGSLTGVNYEQRASLIIAVGVHCPNIEEIDLSPDTSMPGVSTDAQLMSKKYYGTLIELRLTGSCLSDKFVYKLFLRYSTAFQSLSTLKLSGNKIGVETIKAISSILQRTPCNQLKSLDLSNNPLGVPGVKVLEDAVHCNILDNLEKLNLSGFLTSEKSKQIATLDLIEALSVHCPNLKLVDFSMNGNDVPGIKLAHAILNYNKMFITKLYLIGSCLSDMFVSELFQRASITFHCLKILNISDNKIGVESIKALSLKLQRTPSNTLEVLDLSNNPLGVSGLQALEEAVCCDLLRNLLQLNLQKSLTRDADINGALLTTFTEALSKHTPFLELLDFSQNNLSIPGASAVARGSMPGQDILNLNNTMLSDAGLNIFVDNFDEECHAHTVNLIDNNIHGSGVSCLVDNFKQCRDINLSDNPIGLEGVLTIGRFISENHCHLNRLVLSNCQLTLCEGNMYGKTVKDVRQQLCQMSPNSTLITVEVQCNDFSEERIYVLAGIMYLCPNLELLNSSHCQINSNDCKVLLQQLIEFKESSPKFCSKLVHWDLSDNKIDDNGVSMLIYHLASLFSPLGCDIKLNSNPIRLSMLIRLREERKKMVAIQERKVS